MSVGRIRIFVRIPEKEKPDTDFFFEKLDTGYNQISRQITDIIIKLYLPIHLYMSGSVIHMIKKALSRTRLNNHHQPPTTELATFDEPTAAAAAHFFSAENFGMERMDAFSEFFSDLPEAEPDQQPDIRSSCLVSHQQASRD